MNERKNILTILLLFLTLISCKENGQKYENNTAKQNKVYSTLPKQKLIVDYKKNTYHISVGEHYKTSNKIEWHWAALSDPDDKIDSTGTDAYLFLSEPFIKYNDAEYLPSLSIETDKNIITSFTCDIAFFLADTTNAETLFLKILSKDIKQLQNKEIIKSLIDKGFYEKKTQDYIETFILTKGKKYEYDSFEYTVKLEIRNDR